MDHIADALRDVLLTEEITETTPFWAVLAMGLTGRLAADFGARVVRVCQGADPLAEAQIEDGASLRHAHMHSLRDFLSRGKEEASDARRIAIGVSSAPRIHMRLTCDDDTGAFESISDRASTKTVVFTEDATESRGHRHPATEFTIAGRSGLLDIVGRSDARPLMLGGHQISYSTGLSGFLAVAALLHGEDLDRAEVSALGTALWINWKSLAAAAQGRPIPRRSAESGKWRTAPCADGHVALVYFDRDWPVLAKMTGDPAMQALAAERAWTDRTKLAELEHHLEAWVRTQTRQQLSEASKALGLALGAVWTPAELLADPQYRARQFFRASNEGNGAAIHPGLPAIAAAHGEPGASSRRHRVTSTGGPLAGMRIIDLGILTAGASTSAILADLGADVIKVESPTYLDPFRGTPGTSRADGWWNNSDAFKSTNRNKRGICLDLKSPRGRELFLALAAQSDAVVENFRRGVMQRLGIGYDALRAANAGIILASVSSQGENGPDAGNISFGSTLEATSGLAALTAYEDGVPLVTGMDLNYPDQVGSVFAAAAIVASLHAVQRSGVGVHLDISQRELTTYLLGNAIMASAHEGDAARGNASPEYLLQDTFATKDGWIAISLKDGPEVMRALTLADPSMAGANNPDIASCKRALSAWAAGERSQDICDHLNASGLAAAAVQNGQDAWAYAQRSTGGVIHPLARSPAGEIVKGFPLHLPQRPIAVTLAAPNLGQHTEDILRDVLGLQAAEIEQLARDNIIGTRPASPNASRLD